MALVLAAGTAVAAPHPFGFDDMARLGRLGGFDVSRDGKWVVYSVGRADVDENKTTSALWLMPIDRSAPPRKLTEVQERMTKVVEGATALGKETEHENMEDLARQCDSLKQQVQSALNKVTLLREKLASTMS